MVKMRALQHFTGSAGFVRAGEVIEVDEMTARHYERGPRPLAERVDTDAPSHRVDQGEPEPKVGAEYETKQVRPRTRTRRPKGEAA